MQIIKYPPAQSWKPLLQRPAIDQTALLAKVTAVLDDVKLRGDEAVRKYTRQFDGIDLTDLLVTQTEINEATNLVSADLQKAIQQAGANIRLFHEKQVVKEEMIETMPGVQCWRKNIGIEKVGLYIPGGTAPLFSTILMLGIPAKIAGCKEIILCSPPNTEGKLHPAILYTAQLIGIHTIAKIGGVQAIAAMAYGTASMPQVAKIFGPGNQYVTCAKQRIQQDGIAIDMPAGPSEVCVLADETADPVFVAADLISQAEHGVDSQVLFVTTSESLVTAVQIEMDKQLQALPRKNIAAQSLTNSLAIVVAKMEEGINLVNEYAPEHLIIACKNADDLAAKITNAGSVFLGNYSPESVGDYASGTNHTLPTNGYAKAYSGVSVDSFVRKITFQKLTKEGLKNIGHTVMEMAAAEGLEGHGNAVRVRL